MKPPADYFRDNPDALQAWQMIEAAQIPPEAWCDYSDCLTASDERLVERVTDAQNANRRAKIRNVAAEIARRWPGTATRNLIWVAIGCYVLHGPLWRDVKEVFEAVSEEAAAQWRNATHAKSAALNPTSEVMPAR